MTAEAQRRHRARLRGAWVETSATVDAALTEFGRKAAADRGVQRALRGGRRGVAVVGDRVRGPGVNIVFTGRRGCG